MEQFTKENMLLVKKLAKIKKKTLNSPQIMYEDLVSEGCLALLQVKEKYDQSKGSLASYASKRIFGAMDEYAHQIFQWGKRHTETSVPKGNSMSSLTEDYCYLDNGFNRLIEDLPEEGQKILQWYYVDQLKYKEIGQKLGVTKSRVAQIVKSYLEKLRDIWK